MKPRLLLIMACISSFATQFVCANDSLPGLELSASPLRFEFRVSSSQTVQMLSSPGQDGPSVVVWAGSRRLDAQSVDLLIDAKEQTWSAGKGMWLTLISIRNRDSKSLECEPMLVWDVPDGDNAVLVQSNGTPVDDESSFVLSKGETVQVVSAQGGILSPGGKTLEPVAGPERLIIANLRRLLAWDVPFEFRSGRTFSALPSSIDDRGLAVDFGKKVIAPSATLNLACWYMEGREPASSLDDSAMRSSLEARIALANFDAETLPGSSAPEDTHLKEVNMLLERIARAVRDGSLTMAERERIYEELERLEAQGR